MGADLVFGLSAGEITGLVRLLMLERLLATDLTGLYPGSLWRLKLRYGQDGEQNGSD